MKTIFFTFFPLLFWIANNVQVETPDISKDNIADSVLKKTLDKLDNLKRINYHYQLELNYASENYYNKLDGNIYLDFQSNDTIVGLKYQIEDEEWIRIFNGTEKFDLNKNEKTVELESQPRKKVFANFSFFNNSIITLKNVLPEFIADSTIHKILGDTVLNGTYFYRVGISFVKKGITPLGSFFPITLERNLLYKIIIDKETYLPVQVIQTNSANEDLIKTSFTNFNTDPKQPSELSWYYSTYMDEYKIAKQKEVFPLLTVGSVAPDWILPFYNKDKNLSLSAFKGKVVLLDFWIKNCGPCIESVPHLNELKEKFSNKKFELLSINVYDPKEDVIWFCNRHKVNYPVLINGGGIAKEYGVNGFPTIILIDKEGRILYAEAGVNKSEVEKLIERSL
ncbi:hypothetical protein GCM10027516_21790 [Niabella aquatica]